ncbi:hypothetical protein GJ496_011214 [Pomphorhynchus laevis]|nr:hypothetical protein GJ496_011214 [Pomphorhynchus laevis]
MNQQSIVSTMHEPYAEVRYTTVMPGQSSSTFPISNYSSLDRNYVNYGTFGRNNQLVLLKNRDGEKRELSSLNDKFAGYIERLKLLELRNKRLRGVKQLLLTAIDSFKDKFQQFYRQEISSVNSLTNNVERDMTVMKVDLPDSKQNAESRLEKMKQMKLEYNDLRKKLENINEELSSRRNDIYLFKRRFDDITEELERSNYQKIEIMERMHSLQEQSQREKMRIQIAESNKQSLKDEITLLVQTQQCEVEEFLQTLIDSWRNEKVNNIGADLSQAICSARKDYECQIDNTRNHLMRKYEQILMHTREKASISPQDQSLSQMIDKMKRVKRNMQGEIDNCRATLSFLRLKESDLNKAILEERDDFEKADQMHRNQVVQIEEQLHKVDEHIQEALKNEVTIKNEINEYRSLLEGNSDNQGGLRGVVESLGRQDDFIISEDIKKPNSNNTFPFKDYSASSSTTAKYRQYVYSKPN